MTQSADDRVVARARYEYKTLFSNRSDVLLNEMNALGQDGWEFVFFHASAQWYMYYFKRVIIPERAAYLSRQASEQSEKRETLHEFMPTRDDVHICHVCAMQFGEGLHMRDRGNTRDGGGEQRADAAHGNTADTAASASVRMDSAECASPPPTTSLLVSFEVTQMLESCASEFDALATVMERHLAVRSTPDSIFGLRDRAARIRAVLRSILDGSK